MAPRRYDRYMLAIGIGTHPKFATLTDSEFRAHVAGVLAVAAMSPIRGSLLVGDLPAEAVHIAAAAGVPRKIALTTMEKLRAIGVLEQDDEHGCLRVHDWEDINPPPKADRGNAERQARHRARNALRNAPRNADVTPSVTTAEVEVEVEVKNSLVKSSRFDQSATNLRRANEQVVFDAWIEATDRTSQTTFDDKRRHVVRRALGWKPLGDVIAAVRGVRHSSHHMSNRQYSELRVVLRDVAQIENFAELDREHQAPTRTADLVEFLPANREMNGAP